MMWHPYAFPSENNDLWLQRYYSLHVTYKTLTACMPDRRGPPSLGREKMNAPVLLCHAQAQLPSSSFATATIIVTTASPWIVWQRHLHQHNKVSSNHYTLVVRWQWLVDGIVNIRVIVVQHQVNFALKMISISSECFFFLNALSRSPIKRSQSPLMSHMGKAERGGLNP